jgi:hypothetical protein
LNCGEKWTKPSGMLNSLSICSDITKNRLKRQALPEVSYKEAPG